MESTTRGGGNLADWWFTALDQRRFTVNRQRRTAEVVGVHVHTLETWIQLELREAPGRSFLLCLRPGDGVMDAVRAIRAMMSDPLGSC